MKAARRVLCVAVAAAMVLSLAGCWDYSETEDMLYAMGISFDRLGGRLHGAIEVNAVEGEVSSVSAEYLETDGDTFYDVMRNAAKISDKPLRWSHIEAIVISQDIARNDLADLLDMLIRLPQVRNSLVIFVSKEATAREVMLAKNEAHDLNAFNMIGSLRAEQHVQKAPYVQLYKFADSVTDERQSAVLPAVGLTNTSKGKIVEVSGAAVFRGPWLQGFLDEYDTQMYILGMSAQEQYSFPLPADPGGKFTSASVDFILKKVDVVPDFIDGKAKVSIYIRGDIIPVEIGGASTEPKEFKTLTDAILTAFSTKLENSMKGMIKRTQQMGGCDVLNIGYRMRKHKPEVWRQISGRWREYYNAMEVDVRAGVTLRHTGNEAEPISRGN